MSGTVSVAGFTSALDLALVSGTGLPGDPCPRPNHRAAAAKSIRALVLASPDLSATSAGPDPVPASPAAVAVVATASALVDNPERRPTHWHPAVPSTSAPLPPAPEPGAASC